ncbi:MAG: STAS/SEC14 domain-containing protein, partial [Methanolobus sp.]|nr:STAS/SEC14 domain-containing protein [Methanolobus sp.]
VGVTASGVVKEEDYDKILKPLIEDKIQKHEMICMLYHLDESFEKFTRGALLEDAKIGKEYFTSFEKIAVVSNKDWVINAVEIFKFVIPASVKTFSNEELANAKVWVSE